MTYEKKIHLPQEIVGTRDFKLFLLGEVSEIEEPELAVGDHYPHGACVLSVVDRGGRFSVTKRIRLPRAGQRFSDVIARRADHAYLNTFDRQSPSGLDNHVSVARYRFLIRRVVSPRDLRILKVRPVIHEGPDLDPIDQLRDSAHVASVIVSDQDVVDLLESGLM